MAARTLLTRSAVVALCVALAACGRAGPLEPPPASVSQGQAQTEDGQPEQDRPFVLDRLLE